MTIRREPEVRSRPVAPATPASGIDRSGEAGVALIMVVIFTMLLIVLVADLVITARMARSTGQNDALMARMDNHISLTLIEVLQELKDDLEGGGLDGMGAAGGGGEGPTGGNPLGGGLSGAGGEGEGEEEPPSDSSNDSWFQPKGYGDGDLTTYVWVEDENRKFNILTLASPDEEFADESKERLIRLITSLREGTLFEISNSDATTIADSIKEWLEGFNRDDEHLPKPKLKSDSDETDRKTIPLHLDEILLLRGVDEKIFYDLVMEGPPIQLLPGLLSVLTIYTSYRADPGDPEKNARRAAQNPNANPNPTGGENAGANTPGQGGAATAPEPEGLGVHININTATRPVLRCLFSAGEVPNSVIDAILKYRNEEAPEEEGGEGAEEQAGDYQGDVLEGLEPPKQIFKTLADLEEVPEFSNIADQKVKDKFLSLLSTQSDVFTIHIACVYKRNEERKLFVMNCRRCVVVRLEGDEETRLYPIIRLERYRGLRMMGVDFPEQEEEKRLLAQDGMDPFATEERKWNPFFLEFYEKTDAQTDVRRR